MSWGFFLDLEATMPTATWKAVQSVTGAALPDPWWGFGDADLERTFRGDGFEDMTFERAWSCFEHGSECVKAATATGDTTTVRFATLLDKSGEPQMAMPFAAMCQAAAKTGATGHIQLVNDGSYAGEPGVKITLQSGAVMREELAEDWDLREALGIRVFAQDDDDPPAAKPKVKAKAKAKPKATAQPKAKAKPTTKPKPKPTKKPAKKSPKAAKSKGRKR